MMAQHQSTGPGARGSAWLVRRGWSFFVARNLLRGALLLLLFGRLLLAAGLIGPAHLMRIWAGAGRLETWALHFYSAPHAHGEADPDLERDQWS